MLKRNRTVLDLSETRQKFSQRQNVSNFSTTTPLVPNNGVFKLHFFQTEIMKLLPVVVAAVSADRWRRAGGAWGYTGELMG